MTKSKITVLMCACMFLFCGVALNSHAADPTYYTINFKTNDMALINLGPSSPFAIPDTEENLNVSTWGFASGVPSYPKEIAWVNKDAPSGSGIGVIGGGNTVNTPLVSGTREKEYLLFELPNEDWYFVSVKLELLDTIQESRNGWIEVALRTPQKKQILDPSQLPAGIGLHGPLGDPNADPPVPPNQLAVDPTEKTLAFMSYDNSANPQLWVGSYLMSAASQNMFFYVSEVTIAKVPEPATIESVIAFLDESIESGAIVGEDSYPPLAGFKLKKMRKILLIVQWLLDEGLTENACFVLDRAYLRMDGEGETIFDKDLVMDGEGFTGATAELAGMITELSGNIGCE